MLAWKLIRCRPREGPAVRPELVKKRRRGLAHDAMTVRCSCRTGCDRPTARRQSTIPMLLSFQRPDAKKARPPSVHDPTAPRKRRASGVVRGHESAAGTGAPTCSARAEADTSRSSSGRGAVGDLACTRGRVPPGTRERPRATRAGHGSDASSPTAASVRLRPAAGDAAPHAAAQDAPRDRRAGLARARPRLARSTAS